MVVGQLDRCDGVTVTAPDIAPLPVELHGLINVIDNFLPDFEAVRAAAYGAAFKVLNGRAGDTGMYSDFAARSEDMERISKHAGLPLGPLEGAGTGRFALRTSTMTGGTDIHADANLLGGILYVGPVPGPVAGGGTSIFRHRATGLDRFPSKEEQRELGLADDERGYQRYFSSSEGLDRSNWDEVYRVDFVPNRLLLIAGGLFHSYTSAFGSSLADGRLVQLYFLNPR